MGKLRIWTHVLQTTLSKELFKQMLSKFPLSFPLMTVASLWLIFNLLKQRELYDNEYILIYYSYSILFLDIALKQRSELSKKRYTKLIYSIIHLLWFGNILWLMSSETITLSMELSNASALCAMIAGILVGPKEKEKKDDFFYHYATQIIRLTLRTILIGIILFLGMALILKMINVLLDFIIYWKYYLAIGVLCCWIALSFFLINISNRTFKTNNILTANTFGATLGYYIFLPLICVYTLVLYIYTFLILVSFSLPKGGVVLYITIFIAALLATIILVYPHKRDENKRKADLILNILPWLAIPLLILMSIAIARRLIDYGPTVARLYVIVFNLWCYFAIGYIILTKGSRIRTLITSFALCFCLSSIGWPNITKLTGILLQRQLMSLLDREQNSEKLPLDRKQLEKKLKTMKPQKAELLIEKLFYLKEIDPSAYLQFAQGGLSKDEFELPLTDNTRMIFCDIERKRSAETPMPQGYTKIQAQEIEHTINDNALKDGFLYTTLINDKGEKIPMKIELQSLEKLHQMEKTNELEKQQIYQIAINDSACFIVHRIYIVKDAKSNGYLHIEGYLLTK